MRLSQESPESVFKHARIHALEDGDDAFKCHFPDDLFFSDANPQLPCDRKEEEICQADSIDGGDECHGDAAAHFIDLVEMLHDLNQAENGADNSYGWRKAAGRFKQLRNFFFLLFFVVEFEFDDLA